MESITCQNCRAIYGTHIWNSNTTILLQYCPICNTEVAYEETGCGQDQQKQVRKYMRRKKGYPKKQTKTWSRKRVTEEQRKEIRELSAGGFDTNEIAEKTGLSKPTVYRTLVGKGGVINITKGKEKSENPSNKVIKRRGRPPKIRPEAPSSEGAIVAKKEETVKPLSPDDIRTATEMLAMKRQGMDIETIATKYGTSEKEVMRLLMAVDPNEKARLRKWTSQK
jgi:hypothetical protein